MNFFVTGGTGFIGKFVVEKLSEDKKSKVLVLTRGSKKSARKNRITFINGDLSNIKSWEKLLIRFKPDVCIHLAWEEIPDYSFENSSKNLKYSLDLLNLLIKTKCKTVVAAGSLWEYGDVKGKLSESIHTLPFNSFTASKNALFQLGSEMAKEKREINFIWARLFYVYGPGLKRDSLIPYLIKCAKENVKPEIRNPDAQNDFVYVEDAAEAIYKLALNSKKSGVYNVGSGELVSVKSIIKQIFESFGNGIDYKVAGKKRLDSLSFQFADISKIKKDIGWKPRVRIDEGIKRTIKGYLSEASSAK